MTWGDLGRSSQLGHVHPICRDWQYADATPRLTGRNAQHSPNSAPTAASRGCRELSLYSGAGRLCAERHTCLTCGLPGPCDLCCSACMLVARCLHLQPGEGNPMKTVPAGSVPNLPRDVLLLIQQGIYSLYEIRAAVAKYLLVTPQQTEFYLLDADGQVVADPSVKAANDADIVGIVSVGSIPPTDTARPNFA